MGYNVSRGTYVASIRDSSARIPTSPETGRKHLFVTAQIVRGIRIEMSCEFVHRRLRTCGVTAS